MPGEADLGTATGHIQIDSSGAQRGANEAKQALSSLDDVVRNNWWGLRNLGLAFAGFATGVAGSFAYAASSAIKWEDAMAGVERTTYDTTQSAEQNRSAIEGLGNDLRALSSIKPVAAEHLAKIAEEAGALGLKREDVAAFTSVVADLAATTDLTEQEATTSLARIAGIMGVPAGQFQNLASAILETGRSTQATEPEITKLATRLAGIGQTVGLSADQLIGLSAAVSSVGIRAEMGGTAIQKTFIDMMKAISEGGESLELFARVAGVSADEFSTLFQEDAAQALLQFVSGLGKMQAAGQDVTGTLSALEINEARQINTLTRLAAGQQQNVNQNLKMSSALDIANKAYIDNNALQDISARRYETVAAQIQILKNLVAEAGRTFGVMFLPVIKAVVSGLQNFLTGLAALPEPIRIAVTIMTGLTAAMFAFAAAILLLGPRIILIKSSLDALAATAVSTTPALATETVALKSVGTAAVATATQLSLFDAANMKTGATAATTATQLTLFNAAALSSGAGAAKSAKAVTGVGAAAAGATPFVAKLAGNAGKFAKGLGILGAIASVASIAIGIFGSQQAKAVDPAERLTEVNLGLVEAIKQSNGANAGAADQFLLNALAMSKAIPVAQRLGFTLAELISIIKGTADPALAKRFVSSVTAAEKKGDKEAKGLGNSVRGLREEWKSAINAANALLGAESELGIETDDLTQDTKELEKAQKDAQRALEESNRAIMSLVDAYFAQRQAGNDLADAQERLNELMADAANPAQRVAKAERELRSSRAALAKANDDVAQAEADLATARSEQLDDLLDAENKLADAQDKYLDSLEKIQKVEKDLEKLRRGPTLRELTEAINKLRNAELSLVDAHQEVEDAEWQLNYLRQEGASARDVLMAERALEKARQNVADTEEDLAEVTEELNDLRDGASAEELAKAERDLAGAYRDSQEALRDISEGERDVKEIRAAIASDTAYRDAQRQLEDAHLAVADAADRHREAEVELHKTLSGLDIQKEIERQLLEVEQALYRSAQAAVEVRKQQALARGEFVDSGREAQWLADELSKVADAAPSEAARKRLQGFIKTLRQAKPGSPPKEDAPSSGGGPPKAPSGGGGGDVGDPGIDRELGKMDKGLDKSLSNWEKFKGSISTILAGIGGAIAGAKLGAAIGTAIGGPFGTVIGGVAGLVIGLVVSVLLKPLIDKIIEYGPQIVEAIIRFFRELPGKISQWGGQAVDATARFLNELPGKAGYAMGLMIGQIIAGMVGMAVAFVEGWLKIAADIDKKWEEIKAGTKKFIEDLPENVTRLKEDLPRKFSEAWTQITADLDAWWEGHKAWWRGLPDRIVRELHELAAKLRQKAKEGFQGLVDGLNDGMPGLGDFVRDIPRKIVSWIGRADEILKQSGKDIALGLLNGILGPGFSLYNRITAWVKENIPDAIKDILGISSPSKEAEWLGKNVAVGLLNGILSPGFNLYNKIMDWVKSNIPGPIRKILGISSPSKLMQQYGEWTTEGLYKGMLDKEAELSAASKQLAKTVADSFGDTALGVPTLPASTARVDPRSVPVGVGAAAAQAGDTFNISTVVQSARELADEIAWTKIVRTRD